MRRAFDEWRFVASDAVRRRAARAAVADARRARALARAFSAWRERSARADLGGAIGGASRAMGETRAAALAASVVSSGSRERARTAARVGRGRGIKKCSRRG